MAGTITRSIGGIHASSYDFVAVHKNAADGDFVCLQCELALCLVRKLKGVVLLRENHDGGTMARASRMNPRCMSRSISDISPRDSEVKSGIIFLS